MNVFLWILQGLLAAAFVAAGTMKASQPKEKLATNMAWVEDFSPGMVKFVGVAELLGGLGLVLPGATDLATVLTPLAATGLAVTMGGAVAYHLRKKDNQFAPALVLLVLAVVIAWGRFGPYAF